MESWGCDFGDSPIFITMYAWASDSLGLNIYTYGLTTHVYLKKFWHFWGQWCLLSKKILAPNGIFQGWVCRLMKRHWVINEIWSLRGGGFNLWSHGLELTSLSNEHLLYEMKCFLLRCHPISEFMNLFNLNHLIQNGLNANNLLQNHYDHHKGLTTIDNITMEGTIEGNPIGLEGA